MIKKLILFFLLLSQFCCVQKKLPIMGKTEFQKNLNSQFKDASRSPLKDKERKNFKGLDFFSVDSNFIVKAHIELTPDSEWFKMKTTTERITEERVYGVLRFQIRNKLYKLNIYQGKEMMLKEGFEDYLFLPFLDDTNGESTYGGGRYLDAAIPIGDTLVIDFNQAYNPYCVYNEKYSCPLVPRVNYLPIKVTAGVKAWKKN